MDTNKTNILENERIGELIFTNSNGYQVYALSMFDEGSQRISVGIYTVAPDGTQTPLETIKRSAIITRKNVTSFLFDIRGDFKNEEVEAVTEILEREMFSLKTHNFKKKKSIPEIRNLLCEYIATKSKKDNTLCYVKDNLGYIKTSHFNDFIAESKIEVYKRVDILSNLKAFGYLVYDTTRSYDKLIKKDGVAERYYVVKMTCAEVCDDYTSL